MAAQLVSEQRTSVTLQDIADLCGVHKTTVSLALRADPRISPSTTDRIIAAARELGYDPARQHAARALSAARRGGRVLNYTIALAFAHDPTTAEPFHTSNYFGRIQQGVLDVIVEDDFEILTTNPWMADHKKMLPLAYRKGDVDGFLVLHQFNEVMMSTLRMLREEPNFDGRPVVGLVEPIDGASAVYPDNRRAGYLLMSHLLDHGHRKVLTYLNRPTVATSGTADSRYRGYAEAAAERGLNIADVLVRAPAWENTSAASAEELLRFLRQRPEITAIAARNDDQAVRIAEVLKTAGYRMPEDYSLASFDDTDPLIDEHGHNILTTVRLPLVEMGRQGTRLVIRRILGHEPVDRDIMLPVELVERGSVTTPRGSH